MISLSQISIIIIIIIIIITMKCNHWPGPKQSPSRVHVFPIGQREQAGPGV